MATGAHDSSDSSSSITDVGQTHEYYEELDNRALDFRKRKAPKLTRTRTPTPIPTQSFVKEPSPVVDPIQKLNEQLNRQYRPDLVPPSPSPPPILPKLIHKRTPSPDPVIFDARAKPIKSSKEKKETSVSFKQRPFNRSYHVTEPTLTPASSFKLDMPHQQTTADGFQVPPGMILVPAPQQPQYKPSTLNHNPSFKMNKVAPPPAPVYNTQTVNHNLPNNSFQSPSSMMSTNQLIQSSYALKQQQERQQQQNFFKHIDESKSSKKKQTHNNLTNTKNANRSFALYNQQKGRIESVVKNRINVATDDVDESRILDDETEPKGKWELWLSQTLCLGLTRLSGGMLFGSMIILGCAAIAGLIASIVLYNQDSITNAQWKILGMVVCAIMLITIIVTLLVFVYCYKNGYMFDNDDDIDPTDPSTTQDAEGNERQKAILRKIYKFNRPNDTPIPSNVPHDVPQSPQPIPQPSVQVNDKQTNTETTIALKRPNDLDRGVWPSINAYGGRIYRPLVPPVMVHRLIQVFPHEIEQTLQPPPVIYQVVAPAAAVIQPPQVQQRIMQVSTPESTVIEYVEPAPKQPRTIQIPPQQGQIIEYVEAPPKQRRTIQIPAQQGHIIEYVEAPQKQPRTIQIPAQQGQIIEYVEAPQKQSRTTIIRQPQTQHRIEYVDDQRPRRIVQKPPYEVVEEITDDRPTSASSTEEIEEIVEIVDAPKHGRRHGRKKEKKQGVRKVSVKHLKSSK